MSTSTQPAPKLEDAHSGYRQTLHRSLGQWATFAAGISFISVLTGTFQLFGFGLAIGGGAYWWTVPMIGVGQMLVALLFAELAGLWPFAGSVYTWSKRLAGATWSWLAGWVYIIAALVTVAAVALAYQAILPVLWHGFQFIGSGGGPHDVQINGVILGVIGLIFATTFNLLGVRIASLVNQIGVAVELGAVVVLVVALAIEATRGPAVVTHTLGTAQGHPYIGAFLVAALAPAYVLYGFDTASSLGEESNDPHRNAPRSVIQAPLASAVAQVLLVLVALMAAPSLTSSAVASGGLAYIVQAALGKVFGNVMLVCVVIAVSVCLIAIEAATVRMVFAMARDGNLPFSRQLGKVHDRAKVPIAATLLVPAIALIVLLINIDQTQIVAVITSVGVSLIYLAYVMITLPMLRHRLAGTWKIPEGRFSLGAWGLPINILAIIWGIGMAVNLSWPRATVYNPTAPKHWYLLWGGVMVVGLVYIIGFGYYQLIQRHKAGVLEEHRLTSDQEAPIPVEASSQPGA